jgi:hypothetical protein
MSIFQTKNAEIFERGQYLTAGRYKLEIERCLIKSLRAGGSAFIAEGRVLESSNEADHPVGSKRTWFQKQNESFQSSMKAFGLAMCGAPTHSKAMMAQAEGHVDHVLEAAIDPARNALHGFTVRVDVFERETKAGGTFSQHDWEPSGDHDLGAVLARVTSPAVPAAFAPPKAFVAPPPPPPTSSSPAIVAPRVLSQDGRYYLDERANAWIPVA